MTGISFVPLAGSAASPRMMLATRMEGYFPPFF
jgi:hypothetical protein